jgi:YD repeat-containing protein
LLSENRFINGILTLRRLIAHKISYTYTLSGQLASVTDPFNALISYIYDNAGRTLSVGGSSYGGVTSYASNVQYRAWSAVKSATFTDNTAETISTMRGCSLRSSV